jgi:hypothetical protein
MSKNKNRTFDIVIGTMLFVVVGIMPLVVRAAFRLVPPESVDILKALPEVYILDGVAQYLNLFSDWRSWFIGLPAVVIAFYCISDVVTSGNLKNVNVKGFFKDPVLTASGVFLLFVFLSAVFSDFSYTAWFGTYDRNEGAWMWLGYFIVFFATLYYIREPKNTKIIIWGLVFSSLIMGLIGLSQFAGRDFIGTAIGQWLVAGHLSDQIKEFNIRFDFAFGTLYNPNTFGLYTAMLAPFLLITAFTYDGKRFVNVLLFVAGGLMLVGVFGSRSLGGFVGITAAAGIVVFTLLCTAGKPRRFDIKYTLTGAGLLPVIVLSLFLIPPLNERFIIQRERFQTAIRAEVKPVYDFTFKDNQMHVYLDERLLFSANIERDIHPGTEIPLGAVVEWITVSADGQQIPLTERSPSEGFTRYGFDIPGYGPVVFTLYSDYFAYNRMRFVSIDNQIWGLTAIGLPIDMAEPIPAWGFRGRESWGSNRGYIFSRSFPLMPGTWLIGSGPDSFINVFPQNDITGKMQHMATPHEIVDKAHNLYLQTWITTGGISALALVFLFGFYMVTTFLSLIRRKKEKNRFVYGLQLGLLAAVGAFCVASMATDSTVGSTGVFFVLLGLGFGVNRYVITK